MRKILIVDDAKFMLKVTSMMLSSKYETVCASSGEEALELFEKEKPDMVLTDLVMPGMSGLELQQALLDKYQEQIPVMLMTADEREENETKGLEGGAMDYIRKPFTQEVLLRRVDNIMRHIERIQGLKIVAQTDPMTGLLNKAHVQKVLGDVCARAVGTLMMIDLDSFKLVNDLYGHGMGDKILIRFADIIRSVIRSSDIAGRMGGDEFIVFCQDTRDEEMIAEKARVINEEIFASAKEYMGEEMNIPLGASIGAVMVPDEGTRFAELYHMADKALYRVKQNGKHGCAVFRSESAPLEEEQEKENATTLEAMRMILEERNRQRGAYELGREQFKNIFRYQVRVVENYHRPAMLVLFSMIFPDRAKQGSVSREETMDAFGEILGRSLRRSDVYTRNGKSRYLVLLPEIDGDHGEMILKRILESWGKSEHAPAAITYETSLIDG